jgi:predicted lipid-binding transport protein (Tim44 family)
MWKGLLGGALLGLGLGALFSHLGIGGAMASMLSTLLMLALLAFAVMFIVRMFRRKDTPANPISRRFQSAGAGNGQHYPGNRLRPAPAVQLPGRLQPPGYPMGKGAR